MELILAVMLSRQVYVCDVPVTVYRAVLFYGDFCWCKKKRYQLRYGCFQSGGNAVRVLPQHRAPVVNPVGGVTPESKSCGVLFHSILFYMS